MPNIQSAKKELRKKIKRQARNKQIKDKFKLAIKNSRKAIAAKEANAKELVFATLTMIDKAAQKGVIKKNTRDRKKSRLHRQFNQIIKI